MPASFAHNGVLFPAAAQPWDYCQQTLGSTDMRGVCRLLGHVAFRLRMLGRYGTVVTVAYSPGKSNVESMAGAVKAAVEAKMGLPLDSFRC